MAFFRLYSTPAKISSPNQKTTKKQGLCEVLDKILGSLCTIKPKNLLVRKIKLRQPDKSS
jgi:hypothetical protein